MIEKVVPQTHTVIRISIKSLVDSVKLFFRGGIRKFNFEIAKSEAIRRCLQENRKVYVIEASPIHWKVFTSQDVRKLKKMGVFKKDLTFLEMEEKSAFVARPEYQKNK